MGSAQKRLLASMGAKAPVAYSIPVTEAADMKKISRVLTAVALCATLTSYSRAENDTSPTAADITLDRVLDAGSARSAAPAPRKDVPRRPDAWITAKVKAELLAHKNTSALKTGVDTADGVVTLTGEAKSRAEIELAESYAEDVEGVSRVIGKMTVSGERSIEARVDDATITARVKAALLSHRSTSALNTEVHTIEGVVTVQGRARSEAEKELVERLARKVEGVRRVDNKIAVE